MERVGLDGLPGWLARRAGSGGRVYVQGCAGEPLALADSLRRDPGPAKGLGFFGVWIPGVNRTDWAGFGAGETIFASPDWQDSLAAGRLSVVPETYSATFARYAAHACDVAVVQVTPPDTGGQVSLGVSADFSTAVLERARAAVALVNPALLRPRDGVTLPLSRFDAMVDAPHPLLTVPPAALDPAFARIAANIRGLLQDGDTLQFGLGKVQAAILADLEGLRDIRIHSGMVSDPVADLLDGDVLAQAPDAVTTGVALGSVAFYERVAADDRVRFRPVGFTHDIRTLAAIPNLVAINSVIEVDLAGQANAEHLGDRWVSGGGGLLDFLRGARLSPGGRPVAALVSTAKGGAVSRIVPRLSRPATVPRADIGLVVTEHGVADLRGLDAGARARALIAIADPAHRAALEQAWRSGQ